MAQRRMQLDIWDHNKYLISNILAVKGFNMDGKFFYRVISLFIVVLEMWVR